jgi:hypothetical protein
MGFNGSNQSGSKGTSERTAGDYVEILYYITYTEHWLTPSANMRNRCSYCLWPTCAYQLHDHVLLMLLLLVQLACFMDFKLIALAAL